MPDVRTHFVAAMREKIARARGVARWELNRAEQRAGTATAHFEQARRATEEERRRAAVQRDAGLAEAANRQAALMNDLAAHALWAAERAIDPPQGTTTAPPVRIGHMIIGGIEVPALVPLLDHGHIALHGSDRAAIDRVLLTILFATLDNAPAGSVRMFGYDPEHLGGRLASFAPLASAGLLSFAGSRGLTTMLDGLADTAHRISHTVLAGDYVSLSDRAEHGEGRPEPWRLAVIFGDGTEPTAHERAQLRRLLHTSAACGIHVIVSDIPITSIQKKNGFDDSATDPTTTIDIDSHRAIIGTYPTFHVILDSPPPITAVTNLARRIADQVTAGPPPTNLGKLLPKPDAYWTHRSTDNLVSPIGEDSAGNLVELVLADHPPHALIGGPTGSGKTNLIYAWLAGLTTRYSPDELELYLLDFKEGVSFARFAPTPRDPTWLPHVRLVGLNANTDREFGVALLRYLGSELRRRAEAAKQHGVTKLAELREDDPHGHWPRIVAVIDEFQVLFGARDGLTSRAVDLLEDLARRGRSQGIHLILASQDVSGIEALWGRSSLLAQLTLRIALPKARRVLVETNPAADEIPRYHAVINTESGVSSANTIVHLPDAGDRAIWNDLLTDLTNLPRLGQGANRYPRLFDGDAVPLLEEATDYLALRPVDHDRTASAPVAFLGEAVDVVARSVTVALGRSPGRNLAVLGTAAAEARSILDAAAKSLARQYDGCRTVSARFSVAWLDNDAHPGIEALRSALPPTTQWYDRDTILDLLVTATASLEVAEGSPHFILLYGIDAVAGALSAKKPGGSGHDLLRKLLHLGPERHTHVLGWWRSIPRLRDDLGGITARFDAIGAWIALNVHGSELSSLSPSGPPVWYPRPWRALFFDRGTHRDPEVVIPYREAR